MDEENLKLDSDELFTDDEALLACEDAFKIKYMYPWQHLVVANVLEAVEFFQQRKKREEKFRDGQKDAYDGEKDFSGHQIVLLPTGAGKSLCFQVPALLLDGPTLIIYPLLALMTDQARRMNEGGLNCVVFRGGQSSEERNENFRKIREAGYKIIIANPEILENENIIDELCACNIRHIAIDEAHTVWEWGSSFRKSYLNLGKIIKKLDVPVVTAFTATASPEVLENINQILFDGDARIVRSESDRPNIHYYVYNAPSKKSSALFLSKTEEKPMIIFCSTRLHAEDMSREINTAFGDDVSKFYHAGLEKDEKLEVEKWFFDGKNVILCATCAYGMGIDKSDIRTVIHLDPPETAESYVQEAGRGGRDRKVANAILLWNYDDYLRTKDFKWDSRKAAVRNFALTKTCRRQALLDALGAEEAFCSGCDICDLKRREKNRKKSFFMKFFDKRNLMPGEKLPDSEKILYEFIENHNRLYGVEELEKEFLNRMNFYSLKQLGIKIWNHDSFEETLKELLSKKKIKLLNYPWKGKFSVENIKKHKTKEILL